MYSVDKIIVHKIFVHIFLKKPSSVSNPKCSYRHFRRNLKINLLKFGFYNQLFPRVFIQLEHINRVLERITMFNFASASFEQMNSLLFIPFVNLFCKRKKNTAIRQFDLKIYLKICIESHGSGPKFIDYNYRIDQLIKKVIENEIDVAFVGQSGLQSRWGSHKFLGSSSSQNQSHIIDYLIKLVSTINLFINTCIYSIEGSKHKLSLISYSYSTI